MSTRAAWVLGACLVVAAVLHAWLCGGPSAGRYQLVRAESSCLLLDTKTGRVWVRFFSTSSGPSSWDEATGPWAK